MLVVGSKLKVFIFEVALAKRLFGDEKMKTVSTNDNSNDRWHFTCLFYNMTKPIVGVWCLHSPTKIPRTVLALFIDDYQIQGMIDHSISRCYGLVVIIPGL
jgi:hypothetical protein